MAHSGIPGASLLSSNPKYNPAGTIGTYLPDIGAAAGEIVAPGNPLSTAAFLTKGGFDLSQGNTLGGIANLIGGGLGAFGGFGGGTAGAAAPAAGGGAAVTGPAATGFGTSLSDFLSNPSLAGAGNVATSGWQGLLNSLGLGSNTATTQGFNPLAAGGGPIAGGAAPGSGAPFALSPAAGATPEANAVALAVGNAAGLAGPLGGAPAAPGGIEGLLAAHPLLTLGGGLLGSELLAPKLSGLVDSGLTSQESGLLNSIQPAVNAANQLIGSETSGNLPPGAQASVSQALNADIEQIKARYAALGDSGSAAEQQDIANAQNQSAANSFNIATQATNTGLTALGLTTNVYNTLVQDQLNKQQSLQNAFAEFFSTLGLGTALSSRQPAAA